MAKVTTHASEVGCTLEYPSTEVRRRVHSSSEGDLQPALSLTQVPAQPPEPPQRRCQAQCAIRVSSRSEPLQRRPQVVVLPLQHVKPASLIVGDQLRPGRFRKFEEVARVRRLDSGGFCGNLQLFCAVLPLCFQLFES